MYEVDLQGLFLIPISDAACDYPWAACVELSVVHTLCLPLLDLAVCRKNQAVHQSKPFSALGPGLCQLKSQSSQRFALIFFKKLITELSSTYTPQMPALSSTGWNRIIPADRAIASSEADDTWRGVFCIRKMVSVVLGMTEHVDHGG